MTVQPLALGMCGALMAWPQLRCGHNLERLHRVWCPASDLFALCLSLFSLSSPHVPLLSCVSTDYTSSSAITSYWRMALVACYGHHACCCCGNRDCTVSPICGARSCLYWVNSGDNVVTFFHSLKISVVICVRGITTHAACFYFGVTWPVLNDVLLKLIMVMVMDHGTDHDGTDRGSRCCFWKNVLPLGTAPTGYILGNVNSFWKYSNKCRCAMLLFCFLNMTQYFSTAAKFIGVKWLFFNWF